MLGGRKSRRANKGAGKGPLSFWVRPVPVALALSPSVIAVVAEVEGNWEEVARSTPV